MLRVFQTSLLLSLLFCGAIFGFFYAWICSTIWGLSTLPAIDAIAAMQAMNASVRNMVFAPAFFGTTPVLWGAAVLGLWAGQRKAATLLGLAGAIYLGGGFILTMTVNVPMNLALADVPLTLAPAEAAVVWSDYVTRWEVYNIARTIASGLSLALVGAAGIWGAK